MALAELFEVPRMYFTDMAAPLSVRVLPAPRQDAMYKFKILNDADYWVYFAGFSVEKVHYWVEDKGQVVFDTLSKRDVNAFLKANPHLTMDDDVTMADEVGSTDDAISRIEDLFTDVMCATNEGAAYSVYISNGEDNFRDEYATIAKYKGERPDDGRPMAYDALRKHLIDARGGIPVAGIEADDAVAHNGRKLLNKCVIVSADKDLDTIPGFHLNPMSIQDGIYYMSELEACRTYYHSLLTGDRTDNIKCLIGNKQAPGIGKGKADKLLANCTTQLEMLEVVANQYIVEFTKHDREWYVGVDWKDALVENANLLWLRIDPSIKWSVK